MRELEKVQGVFKSLKLTCKHVCTQLQVCVLFLRTVCSPDSQNDTRPKKT